jgi:Flp pilus assembly pilin Flp
MKRITKVLRDQRGQGMTEYIIIAILIALVVMFAVNRFGGMLRNRFGQATESVSSVGVVDTNVQKLTTDQTANFHDSADQDGANTAKQGGND